MKSRMSYAIAALAVALSVGMNCDTVHAETDISGFAELTQAFRVEESIMLDNNLPFGKREYPRGDIRAQLRLAGGGERDEYFLRIDILSDYALSKSTEITIREGYIKLYPSSWLDVKIGRQAATWGTGDLLFVNDLFAKDWVAFFTGQELSYLKKPQDLLRLSAYSGGTTFELAASPYYTMDNIPRGERLSVFNPFTTGILGNIAAKYSVPSVLVHARTPGNTELFARISGYFGATEWALYGYRGFDPQPVAVRAIPTGDAWPLPSTTPALIAPELSSGGASLRGPIGAFMVNAEGAFYYSREDKDGIDPSVPNSSLRWLVGIERNLGTSWTVSTQWYADRVSNYDILVAETGGSPMRDEIDHTLTARIRKTLSQETIRVNLFGFWGASADDYYVRTNVEYDYSDNLRMTAGANWIDGDQPYTMFGQFRGNSNLYLRLRRSF